MTIYSYFFEVLTINALDVSDSIWSNSETDTFLVVTHRQLRTSQSRATPPL